MRDLIMRVLRARVCVGVYQRGRTTLRRSHAQPTGQRPPCSRAKTLHDRVFGSKPSSSGRMNEDS
jgi:hypothetical protein